MRSTDTSDRPYASWRDIWDRHGLFFALAAGVLRPISDFLTPTQWWYQLSWFFSLGKKWPDLLRRVGVPPQLLSRVARFSRPIILVSDDDERIRPYWQDLGVLFIGLATTWFSLNAYFEPPTFLAKVGIAWLLVDSIVQHARILWLDDLRPGKSWFALRVLSHRRVLFQAVLNLIESVFLFGALYRCCLGKSKAFSESFRVATTLSVIDTAGADWISVAQVAFTLFFVVIVISVGASVAFARGEVAPRDPGGEHNVLPEVTPERAGTTVDTKTPLSETVREGKQIAFFGSAVSAWFETRLELDRTLVTLSAGGIGLLVTLLTTSPMVGSLLFCFYVGAMIAFAITAITCLIIFYQNSRYLEKVAGDEPADDATLGRLDVIAYVAFVIGVILTLAVGVIAVLTRL